MISPDYYRKAYDEKRICCFCGKVMDDKRYVCRECWGPESAVGKR